MKKILTYSEFTFFALLFIGIALLATIPDATILIIIGLIGLIAMFILNLRQPLEIEPDDNQKQGFTELLSWLILPKVIWISLTILTAGTLFYFINFGNEGYKQLIFIGVNSLILSTFILLILTIMRVRHLKKVWFIFLRAIPLFLVAMYAMGS